jgi:hypothetical protein
LARQYALPTSAQATDRGDPRGMAGYIRETAKKYGIDPEVALRVAKSEGLSTFQSSVVGKKGREPSWGAFQLYTGGGLGNEFQKETGLDPSDPKNEKATIDYALRHASQHGWKPWHGAKNTGIGEWEGINPEKTAATAAGATPVSEGGATVTSVAATEAPPAATGASTGDWLDRLKNSPEASKGLDEAISGLGKAVTGSSPGMYDTTSRVTPVSAPALSTAAISPTVNPQAVENQRQQLALAMQRLNSGRLY